MNKKIIKKYNSYHVRPVHIIQKVHMTFFSTYRNRQSTDHSAVESINQPDPVLMKRNDSYFAIHVQPSTGGVSSLPQASTSPERVYDIPITLTNETDQVVAEHHDYIILNDSMLKNKDQYDHQLDSSSVADVPKYASLDQQNMYCHESYSYAYVCGTSTHAKDSQTDLYMYTRCNNPQPV